MAKIISGTEIAAKIYIGLKEEISKFKTKPFLKIIQVGENPSSNLYIKKKKEVLENIGIRFELIKFNKNVKQSQLLKKINELNNDKETHGILIQLPIDCTSDINTDLIINSVSPQKDVDGLNVLNIGKLSSGLMNGFIPCTAKACNALIHSTSVCISGLKSVIIGRSKLIGIPIANLLKLQDSTVTICHSKTKNLKEEVIQADIVIAAAGYPELIKGDWIKEGAIVIDCGINNIKGKLTGDVCFEEIINKKCYITPVPKGVGPVTIVMLATNVIKAYKDLTL